MLLFIWAAFSSLFFSESAPDSIFAKKIDYNLQIDAVLDEAIWQDSAH